MWESGSGTGGQIQWLLAGGRLTEMLHFWLLPLFCILGAFTAKCENMEQEQIEETFSETTEKQQKGLVKG